jgi:methionyl-tRNA synthetase
MLVTMALPYANGQLHLGHLVEAIQADIWVRFQKLKQQTCYFISGDDAHGTPIMLMAEKLHKKPEVYIQEIHEQRKKDYHAFHVDLDHYGTTHSSENKNFVELIYKKLSDHKAIFKKEIEQYFDTEKNIFLPDRFIKGTCPKCKTKDQYGDACENCGTTYSPMDLIEPHSVLSGTKPVIKKTEHYFFDLPQFSEKLKQWMSHKALQPEVVNKLDEWFTQGLQPWDISRDAPYFGFKIPGEEDKYFYVWLDAPIGYIAIFKQLCELKNINFSDYWRLDSKMELYHFIGKDVMYFHTLFWPAMLMGAEFRTPTAVFIHGFLTVDGQKMSKSRGTFIEANDYLKQLNPEYLRYYYAAKLTDRVEDIDLNLEDFMSRINSDLVGKVINIASRCAMFINKYFHNILSETCIISNLFDEFIATGETIALYYEKREYSKAVREIMQLADRANEYIDTEKPWALIKQPGSEIKVQEICSAGLNLFLLLITYLKPILPETAKNVEHFMNIGAINWEESKAPLVNHTILTFTPLLQRITPEQINSLRQPKEKSMNDTNEIPTTLTSSFDPLFPEINIDDFAKIDLRIAKIIHAESVEGADKLLKLTLDIGFEKRQVFAGIKSAYNPEDLIGKFTVMVANLAPRKMKFGMSEGMVLAAGPGGKDLWILEPHEGAQPGMRVK